MKLDQKRIVEVMGEKNISMTEIAKRVGCSRQYISAVFERGTCAFKTATKIATAMDIPVHEIVASGQALKAELICPIHRGYCHSNDCAWWLSDQNHCAIAMLARSAIGVEEALSNEIQVVNYEGR